MAYGPLDPIRKRNKISLGWWLTVTTHMIKAKAVSSVLATLLVPAAVALAAAHLVDRYDVSIDPAVAAGEVQALSLEGIPVIGDTSGPPPGRLVKIRKRLHVHHSRDVHPDAQPEAILARVAADKAAVRAALADPHSAADTHFSQLMAMREEAAVGGGAVDPALELLSSQEHLPRYRDQFIRALGEIHAANQVSGDWLAYGITPLSHLTPREYEDMYLGGNLAAGFSGSAYNSREAESGGRGDSGDYDYDDYEDGYNDQGGAPAQPTPPRDRQQAGGAYPDHGASRHGDPGYVCTRPQSWKASGGHKLRLLAAIDYRTSKPALATPVRNQGECASCVVFSNTAAIEAAFIAKWNGNGFNSRTTDLSEQEQMLCSPGNACYGAWPYQYIDRTICRGVSLESSVSYRANDTDDCPSNVTTERYHSGVVAWTFVPNTMGAHRKALSHSPVVIGIDAAGLFQHYSSGIIPCATNDTRMNHVVTLVGYTDQVNLPTRDAAGSGGTSTQVWRMWTAKNSWGPQWGYHGMFYLRADCPRGNGALGMYKLRGPPGASVLAIRG